jgi:hypothetical protein
MYGGGCKTEREREMLLLHTQKYFWFLSFPTSSSMFSLCRDIHIAVQENDKLANQLQETSTEISKVLTTITTQSRLLEMGTAAYNEILESNGYICSDIYMCVYVFTIICMSVCMYVLFNICTYIQIEFTKTQIHT